MTQEEVNNYLRAARDSVWVINEELSKLAKGETPSDQIKGNIERNVGHLEIVVDREEVKTMGGDISELNTAITAGKAKLQQNIWG